MPDARPSDRSFLRRHGPSVVIATLGVVATLVVWRMAVESDRDAIERVVSTEAEVLRNQLESRLEAREEALQRMTERWRVQGRSHEPEWRSDARLYARDFAGMEGFGWVGADGRLRWVEPASMRALLARLLSDSEVRPAIDRLEAVRTVEVVHPRAAEREVAVRLYPLSAAEGPDGFLIVLVDHETMLDEIFAPPVADGYAVTVSDGDHVHDVRDDDEASRGPFLRRFSTDVPGRTWEVAIAPLPATVATVDAAVDELVLAFGLVASILLALAAHLARRARARERALRETESLMHRINENLPVMVAVHRPDLREVLYVNPQFETIYGTPPESILDDPNRFPELVHPGDRERVARAVERDLPRGTFEEEYRVVWPDGEVRWVQAWSAQIGDGSGDSDLVVTVAQDVTEGKRAHLALRETAERLREITENMPVVVTITDPDLSTNHYISPAYEEIYGRPREEIYEDPSSFMEVLHPDDRERVVEAIERDLPTGEFDLEYRILRDERVRWIHAWSAAVREEGGEIIRVVTVAQDVTERKRAEIELKRSNQELQQFAYVASHDLQEPLRMITSYLQLIERRYADLLDERGGEFLDYAVDGAERMKRLINGLLEYSRVHTHGEKRVPTDLDAVLDDALANLRSSIRESGATIVRDDLPVLAVDAGQLTRLFQNLISNAVKFRGEASPRIEVEASERPEAWEFRVSDNGVGFDPALAEQMFVLFRRLHGRDEYPGTGIGLALCRRIVERHGGRIWAESEPGVGSTFSFTLPKRPEVAT